MFFKLKIRSQYEFDLIDAKRLPTVIQLEMKIRTVCIAKWLRRAKYEPPRMGLEPTIPGLGGQCLIH